MAFVSGYLIDELKGKLTSDPSKLGKLYKAKKNKFYERSVDHNLVDEMLADGWEEYTQLKTKTKLRKPKDHSRIFEDDMWCQLYDLGYRCLNYQDDFSLPYGKTDKDRKQIDIIAINNESILLVECKSSRKLSKPKFSLKTEFEGLKQRLDGFSKTLEQMFSGKRKIKYIFATRNLRIESEGVDIERLESTRSFFYDDMTFDYVSDLVKHYKKASHYQFQALLFRGEEINKDVVSVPAIQGKMGGKSYYAFSLEPHILLKLGYILHRTRANQSELPTYQRLLVPSRLKGISKFIDGGGFFPNSIILNFNNNKRKNPIFEPASNKATDSSSRQGILKIPNAYAIAYIIDGQHRLYGYASSGFKETNTIPVVAFHGLEPSEQLKIFMDINQNQKAVSASLRMTLEQDVCWDDPILEKRMGALRSSIVQDLGNIKKSPLYKKITVGEDKGILTFAPIYDALPSSGILPKTKGNQFKNLGVNTSLYDVNNQNHNREMLKTRKSVVKFISLCYEYVEDNYPKELEENKTSMIMVNRGAEAFVGLIGSLNKSVTESGIVDVKTNPEERFEAIKKYLKALMDTIKGLSDDDKTNLRTKYGSGAKHHSLRNFQNYVHTKQNNYLPLELVEWLERQDKELQNEGGRLVFSIESYIKSTIIENLRALFKENWDLEIGSIKKDCQSRSDAEVEKHYKETGIRKESSWTQQFNIMDYKWIIEKHWTKVPEFGAPENFNPFSDIFSIDLGDGFNSKSEKLKWISLFNSHRNNVAHSGTKEQGLSKADVKFLQKVLGSLQIKVD